MSIEVENRSGNAVIALHKSATPGCVHVTVTTLGDTATVFEDPGAEQIATDNFPIRDLLIALHALSGQPIAPEPARPKYRAVSEWFRRGRKD